MWLKISSVRTVHASGKNFPGRRESLTEAAPTVVELDEPDIRFIVDVRPKGEITEQGHLIVGVVEINRFASSELHCVGRAREDEKHGQREGPHLDNWRAAKS